MNKIYYTSRWRCKISLRVMKNISLVSAAQFSPCKKRGKAHVGICPLSSWVSVWLVCRWREIFRLLQLYQIQIFFIFRTINSILIHKLNYKEHNEKRKNMCKLNSCLVFFCLFVGVKIQRRTSIITRWPGLANFPMRKTRIILLTVIHTLIQTCRFVAFVFHLCFVIIFSFWNAPHYSLTCETSAKTSFFGLKVE